MLSRSLATHVAVLATGIGVGLGGVALASGQNVHAASDAQIVSQLKNVNKKLDIVNKNLGGNASYASGPSIKDNVLFVNKSLGGSYGYPSIPTILEELRRTCRNSGSGSFC
jgi:hypothetical protein